MSGQPEQLTTAQVKELKARALEVRMNIVRMLEQAKSGHPGGSLSSSDILSCLYFSGVLQAKADDPQWEQRDRFILSKGHAAPVLYAVLAEFGYIPHSWLDSLRKLHSHLQGHPDMRKCPGVEASTGSLGQGLSIASGLALGLAHDADKIGRCPDVYVLTGDGELQEGQNWEALMYAAHKKISNLIALVDSNNLQIDGKVSEVNSLGNLAEKFKSFGWQVFEANGHDMQEIYAALKAAQAYKQGPCAVIFSTTKGKGISFMENQCSWHGKAPSAQEAAGALEELQAALSCLREEA